MNWKNVAIATVLGGILLTVVEYVASTIGMAVAPYDILAIGGMRAVTDPVMVLYLVQPFVFALAAAIAFDAVKNALIGTATDKAMKYAALLFGLTVIPSLFTIYSSMTYPLGFYVVNIVYGVIGYALVGLLFVKIWKLK